jgi:hypothetical protein
LFYNISKYYRQFTNRGLVQNAHNFVLLPGYFIPTAGWLAASAAHDLVKRFEVRLRFPILEIAGSLQRVAQRGLWPQPNEKSLL